MPEIEVRPAISADIPSLMALDHNYTSEYVWQMEVQREEDDDDHQTRISFRQIRLPRSVRVEYPRQPRGLAIDWTQRSGLLVALLGGTAIGYISLMLDFAPLTTWATDLVVARHLRRKGIGSALVLAALEWSANHATHYLVLEMQPKNYPAIQLTHKLGFELCGYNDRYYENHDIAIFFAKSVR